MSVIPTHPDLLIEARLIARHEVNRLAKRLGVEGVRVHRTRADLRVGAADAERRLALIERDMVMLRTMERIALSVRRPAAFIIAGATS